MNYKGAIDIFWKLNASTQINASINPDFGQVEANELVVNFSAIENFFIEKRPFFRENHELFEIEGPETLRIIHTPNIGGVPDTGGRPSAGIAGAARFTQIGKSFDFGVLSATESDDKTAEGRDYLASRAQYKHDRGRVGLLHTCVDRPGLLRKAQTTSVDFEHLPSGELRFTGQYIFSSVAEILKQDVSDSAWWMIGEWQPRDEIGHSLTIFNYGEQFDVSDFGFVRRVNRKQLEYEFEKLWTDLGIAGFRDATLSFGLEYGTNEQEDRLPMQIEAAIEFVTDSASSWEVELEYRTGGIDDLITRGRNSVYFPSSYASGISYDSPRYSFFSWAASVDAGTDGFQKPFYEFSIEPQLQLSDQINIAIEMEYENSQSWVIHLENNDIGEFRKKELRTTLDISAHFGTKHQLKIKLQSVLLEAKARRAYVATGRGS
tara:strand:- start:138 stop:1436 length:1299 start_codon:yes stop_codon:yes gene_type:complete